MVSPSVGTFFFFFEGGGGGGGGGPSEGDLAECLPPPPPPPFNDSYLPTFLASLSARDAEASPLSLLRSEVG
jgi:hypothetical protein